MMQSVPRSTRRTAVPPLALLAAAMAVGPQKPAFATAEVDCTSVASEALQIELATAASDTRYVVLRSGETLRFAFEAEPGPFGTLTLIEGAGSPRRLLVGPSGTAVAFTAQRSGAFGFRFAKDGEVAARFTVTCASTQAKALRPGSLSPGEGDATPEGLQVSELDAAASSLDLAALPPEGTEPTRSDAVSAPQAGMGPKVQMQWIDQRYRPAGAEGQQVDPSASGMQIGVNYNLKSKVTIGALAQLNPDAEMLLGAQRSLADQGWMAGPFTTIHLAPGLVLDARAAWGEGQSGPVEALAPAAQRRLVSARLANEHAFGAWRFAPTLNFNYLEETLPASASAAEAATAAGRIDVGPALAYHMDLASSAFVEPRVVVGGFWDFDGLAKDAAGLHGDAEMRLKAEAGVTFGYYNGAKLQAMGALEEGSEQAPEAWSGRLQLSVPLE